MRHINIQHLEQVLTPESTVASEVLFKVEDIVCMLLCGQ